MPIVSCISLIKTKKINLITDIKNINIDANWYKHTNTF